MIQGNFIGAAIVTVIYTIYILKNPAATGSKTSFVIALIVLNLLTIVLMAYAFK